MRAGGPGEQDPWRALEGKGLTPVSAPVDSGAVLPRKRIEEEVVMSSSRFGLVVVAFCLFRPVPVSGTDTPLLVFQGGAVFDPVALERHAPGQLWIEAGRIVAEKPLDSEIPAGATVVDAGGCTLLPGLFDLHTHVSLPGGNMAERVAVDAEDHLRSQIYFGVTHVVDVHHDPRIVFGVRERTRGRPELARLYAAGACFTAPHGRGGQGRVRPHTITSEDELDTRFNTMREHQHDLVSAIYDAGGWGPQPEVPRLADEMLAALAAKCREFELRLFVQAGTVEEALTAVRTGCAALSSGIFTGDVTAQLATEMKAHGAGYVPTLCVIAGAARAAERPAIYRRTEVEGALHPVLYKGLTEAPGWHWSKEQAIGGGEAQYFKNLEILADAGVPIGAGTDAGNALTPHGPALVTELGLYVEAGLTPAQALRAATIDAARILGIDAGFGTLEPGKVADVVLVEGDPLARIEDLWRIRAVYKDGARVPREETARRNARRAEPPEILRPGAGVSEALDEFDDGNLESSWRGTWGPSLDERAPSGASKAVVTIVDGALRVEGEVKEGFQWGAWAGGGVGFDPDEKVLVDATGFDGLRMRVRGTARQYMFGIWRAGSRSFYPFSTFVEITPEWREVEVPFATIYQIGNAVPEEWSPTDLARLELNARNSPFAKAQFGRFWYEIDWIRLYRKPGA